MKTFVFNFKARFASRVLDGTKRQTVRRARADGRVPKSGDMAACYTGLRTARSCLLVRAPIVECSFVEIDFLDRKIAIDGDVLSARDADAFAVADGFLDFNAMLNFFEDEHGGEVFNGFVAKW